MTSQKKQYERDKKMALTKIRHGKTYRYICERHLPLYRQNMEARGLNLRVVSEGHEKSLKGFPPVYCWKCYLLEKGRN